MPSTISPLMKVPVVVSGLISTSSISTEPCWNFVTFSTIAVALFIISDAGFLACVIVWPTKSWLLFTACASVCVQRIKVCVVLNYLR